LVVALNWLNALMSKNLRASFFNVLSMIAITSCLARSTSLPVKGHFVTAPALYPTPLHVAMQLRLSHRSGVKRRALVGRLLLGLTA
jgi:hypothetical protein